MSAGTMARSVLLIAGLVLAGVILRSAGIEGGITAAGTRGPAAFVGMGALLCTVGMPRQVVAYAAGLAFGFWTGMALALLCEVIGAAADFAWARVIARDWAIRRLGTGGRIARVHRTLTARPFTATLTLRLLPIGNNLALNLLAGVGSIPLCPFIAASALGYLPQTVVFALLGEGVQVDRTIQIVLAAGLFVVSMGLGWLLMRRGPAVS